MYYVSTLHIFLRSKLGVLKSTLPMWSPLRILVVGGVVLKATPKIPLKILISKLPPWRLDF